MLKESLSGLQKIYSMKTDLVQSTIGNISKTILRGFGTNDNSWYIAAKEFIEAIFKIMPQPDKFINFIIVKMFSMTLRNANNNTDNKDNNQRLSQTIHDAMVIDEENPDIDIIKLAQFIFFLGHVGLNFIVLSEKIESNLKKKKNDKDDKSKKNEEDGKLHL